MVEHLERELERERERDCERERGVKERRNVCFCHSQGERERELCDRNV